MLTLNDSRILAPAEKKPLDHFPVIRTADIDEMKAAITEYYGDVRLSITGNSSSFRAHGNHCQLNYVGISYASYGAAVSHFYPSLSSSYAVPLAAAGSGWGKSAGRPIGVNGRQTLIGSPGLPAELHVTPEFEELTVQMEASAVRRALAGLIGAEVNEDLVFEPVLDFENPVNRLWRRLLQFLIDEVATHDAGLPLAALGEIEQALIVMFLKANRHRFSTVLNKQQPDAAPRQVRLAEEYIEENWDRPISVEILAELTNVSARSLFDSFRKCRGYSPMAFVKQVRLRQARRMLLAPEDEMTVAKVAFVCGFGNLGNFAKDYRDAFGELPSSTLRNAAGYERSSAQKTWHVMSKVAASSGR